jgi:hypothetical protein
MCGANKQTTTNNNGISNNNTKVKTMKMIKNTDKICLSSSVITTYFGGESSSPFHYQTLFLTTNEILTKSCKN